MVRAGVALLLVVGLTGCVGATTPDAGGTASPTGPRLELSGGGLTGPAHLEAYEYEGTAAADADAEKIDPSGTSRTYRISWRPRTSTAPTA